MRMDAKTDAIEARVARGAAWLDENEPGWERRIDLAKLNLGDGCRCVIGQVMQEGDYAATMRRLRRGDPHSCVWPVAHGFNVDLEDDGFRYALYRALDEAWTALLKERFASGLLSDERPA